MPLVRATAALLAIALTGGCGGDEPTVAARDGRVQIELDEFLIRPQNITAPAGPVTFRIAARGRLRHTFRLWGAGREPVRVETLFPGDVAERRADLPPGKYRMVCTVSNHSELGMTGLLHVR